MGTFAKKVYMARMVRELELLTYEVTMARCSNSALKLVIWWGNNIGGGTMLISENELKESADLSIAYWKKNRLHFVPISMATTRNGVKGLPKQW